MKKLICATVMCLMLAGNAYAVEEEVPKSPHFAKAGVIVQMMAQSSANELRSLGAPEEAITEVLTGILDCTYNKYLLVDPYIVAVLGEIEIIAEGEEVNMYIAGIVSAYYWECIEEQR